MGLLRTALQTKQENSYAREVKAFNNDITFILLFCKLYFVLDVKQHLVKHLKLVS